jgi:hypothetical protein
VVTGRQLLERALRTPLQEAGWTPRAAGWFTRATAPGYTGVLTGSVASEHAPAGTGYGTLYVGLRREDVEPVVRELCQISRPDRGYQSRTVVTSIGYLMPDPTWRTWFVAPDTVDGVAAEFTDLVGRHAVPYLERLTADPEALLDELRRTGIWDSAPGPCTLAVLLARVGRPDEGWAFVQERLALLGPRTDAAAGQMREMAGRLREWLDLRAQ